MKQILLLILLVTLCFSGFSQSASQYVFTESTATYTSISSAPGVNYTSSISGDDYGMQNIPIGFTFIFCGTSYTQFSVNSNGWISLANSSTTNGTNAYSNSSSSLANNAGGQGFLMPFWDDLVGSGYTYYITTGTAPNRVFTFQWGDPSTQWGTYSGGGNATFQVIMYESSGVVQFAYGGSGFYFTSGTIGIANSGSDYLTLPEYSSTSPNTSFNTGVSASPAANTLMTWTPPPTILITPAALTFTNLFGTTSAPQTVNVTGYGFTGTNVTVTPPSNYLVYNGSSYVSSAITLPVSTAAVGTYINTTAQLEFVAPATVGTYSGNAAFSSTGATTQNVSLTGNSVNPCTGTPTGGTASISPITGGGVTPFTLTNTGFTIAAGITFQWQTSADGSTGWTNIAGATNSTYTYTGLSTNTYFRCNVTCTNTSATTASSTVMATFIPVPSCTPTASSYSYGGSSEPYDFYYGVENFNLASASGPSLSDEFIYDVNPYTGYVSRTSSIAPITLFQGGTYPATANFYYSSGQQECQVWIDFNNNGVFESSEEVSPVSGYSSSTAYPNNFNVTVPALGALGVHLMRIRGIWENYSTTLGSSPAHLDPCGLNYMGTNPEYYSGTCADYLVNIQAPPPFGSATPAAVTFAATVPGSYAAAQSFSVSGSYMVPASGNLTVTSPSAEFEISPDNSTWYTTSFTIPYTGAFLTSTVYVRFKPSAVSSYSGNITVTGGGISSPINVAVSGVGATACSGAPTGGTASITPANGSGVTVFTLSLSGYTVAGGVTFQWQSSPDGATWANIAGATNATYSFSGLSASMYYRAQVTCPFTPSTVSSTTTSAMFTPVPTCVTTAASWVYGGAYEPGSYYYGVSTFTVTAATGSNLVDNNILSDVNTSTGYLDRTSWAPVVLYQNGVYPAVANFGTTSNFQESQVWIDFNNNGTFETSEEVTPVSGFSTGTTPNPNSFNISIPAAATTGVHLMRVRGNWELTWTSLYTAPAHLDPCDYQYGGSNPQYFSGTAVDYYVDIQVPPPSLTAAPASLTFSATTPSTYSGTQASVLHGVYLVPASGNITVTTPSAEFEISPDNTTWYTTSYTSAYTGSTATPTVYVRFHPSAVASYSGNISVTGGGLSSAVLIAVNGQGVLACSGTPTAGTSAITPSSGGTGTTFALSLSGYTVAGGIGFQWQSSPDGTSAWADISGATLASYTFSGLTATRYYRCNVTCSGSTVPSTVSSATFIPAPGCVPSSSSWTGESGSVNYGISALSITGFSGSTMSDVGLTSSANPSTGYLNRTGTPVVNLQQSGVYAASANWGNASNNQEGQIWIDFNDDGLFSTSEEVTPVFGYSTSSTPNPVSFNISIPLTANVGTHLMRIRGIWETFAAGVSLSSHLDPCLIRYGGSSPDYYSGNVVDYWVNIVELPPCTGTPTAGTVSASVINGCGTSFTTNLSATGTSTGVAGLTYQWQSSADGSSYANVPGATNPAYTATVTAATYYRLNVGCTPSGMTGSSAGQHITINPYPNAISGSGIVCQGSTTTLIETSSGGTWSSGNASVASIGSGTGIVSGVATGTATISFTLPTGCSALLVASVNASPSATILTPGTSVTSCAGTGVDFTAVSTFSGSQVLVSQDFNSGLTGTGGTWTIDNTGSSDLTSIYNWNINYPTGWSDLYVPGDGTAFMGTNADMAGSSAILDTRLISPSFSTVGMNSASVSFNYYCHSNGFYDYNAEIDYSTDGGTTWNTLYDYYNYTSGSTSWTAGFPTQVIDLPADAIGQSNVMLRWYYYTNYGYNWVVDNIVVSAVPNITYAWSGVAGASGLSCLNCANPTITPAATGANQYTITASALGCANATTTVTVNVNAQPEVIAGPTMVCTGATITLANATSGGTWSSASANVSVDAASGQVTGITAGTADVTYSLTSTGCTRIATVTVNDAPAAITGSNSVCNGFTTTLGNITPSGVWSSSNTAYATVNGLGIVSGNATGAVTISYTTLNGCSATQAFTVNAQPAGITGSPLICTGATTPLDDATFGGAWSSSNSNASVTGGNVYGVTPGASTISYTVGSCSATLAVTVGQSPAAIGGSAAVCVGASSLLTNSYAGGTWSSSNANASVDASGNLTGSSVGNATISYTLPAGCAATVEATVNPAASAITGTAVVCVNATTNLSTPDAGNWSSSNTAIAAVSSTGGVTGMAAGTATITFTLPSGCYATQVVSVNAIPALFAMTGGGYFCAGDAGVHIGLTGGETGISYQLYQGTSAMGAAVTGSSSTVDFGVFNTEGTYTVLATNTSTGCSVAMTGSEDVIANPLPVAYTLSAAGSTTGCLGGAGVTLVTDVSDPGINYQLYNGPTASGSAVTGTGADLTFGSVYTSGAYTAVAIDAVTGCHIDMMGTVNVTISSLPAIYTVTGGGHYCAGGAGSSVGLGGSEPGVAYTLYNGTSMVASMTGTGAAIDFGAQTLPGAYTIVAQNAGGCQSNMTGSVSVAIDPNPLTYYVTGGGSLCAGAAGVHVGLSGSNNGINYTLYNGAAAGTTLAGNGLMLDFAPVTAAGTYSVLATDATSGCATAMAGTTAVIVNALPVAHNVTGSAALCPGSAGSHIGVDGSEAGISYQLYSGTSAVGTAMAGTGTVIDFGAMTAAGTYSVMATDISTGCMNAQAGTALITALPAPATFAITGGGAYCDGTGGVYIGLASSASGVKYQLYNGSTAAGTAIAGTSGMAIDFGPWTATGIYSVLATDTATGCTSAMSGTASVSVNALPTVFVVTGGGNYCTGGAGVDVLLSGSEPAFTYQLYNGATAIGTPVSGLGTALNFGHQAAVGTYSVMANAGGACATAMSGSAVVNTYPLPAAHTVAGGGAYCAGGTGVHVSLSIGDAGVQYQLYNGTATVGAAITGTGTAIDFGLMTAAGTYTVRATDAMTCVNGMTGGATVSITPTVAPAVTVTRSTTDTVICSGSTVAFHANAVNGGTTPSFMWTVNGAAVGMDSTGFTYSPADGDVIGVTLTSSATCASPATATGFSTMTVVSNVTPYVSIASDRGTEVCTGSSVTLTATPYYTGATPTYRWMKNGSLSGIGLTYTYTPADGDVVYFIENSSMACVTTDEAYSNNLVMTVDPAYVPVVTVTGYPGITIVAGTTDSLVAGVTGAGPTPRYQWYVGTTAVPGATNSSFVSSALVNGDSVSCDVTGSGACQLHGFNSVTIRTVPVSLTGVSMGDADIHLMPNPNKGEFTIRGTLGIADDQEVTLELTDVLGQVVYHSNVIARQGTINEHVKLSGALANGMYMLSVRTNGNVKVFHMVLEQ